MTHSLALASYADAIDLYTGFDRAGGAVDDRQALVRDVAEWLSRDAGMRTTELPHDDQGRRNLIRHLLTMRPPRPFPADVLRRIDDVFAGESARRNKVGAGDLLAGQNTPVAIGGARLRMWRGDITPLALDAIVNAANADLLGCFLPGHACIDNAIHAVAGPRLRADCKPTPAWTTRTRRTSPRSFPRSSDAASGRRIR